MSGPGNGLWHDSVNLATPHVPPPPPTLIRELVGTLSWHCSFQKPALVVGMPWSCQGKEGTARLQVCLSVLLPSAWCYHLGLFSVPWEAGWGEAGVGQWSGGEKRTHHKVIDHSAYPFPGYPALIWKGFLCLSHTCGLPAVASRKVGVGRAHLMVFRFVSPSSSTSLLLPYSTFRFVFTGVCQHLRHISILSAPHFFIVPITIWSWYLYMYLFMVFISKPPLDL